MLLSHLGYLFPRRLHPEWSTALAFSLKRKIIAEVERVTVGSWEPLRPDLPSLLCLGIVPLSTADQVNTHHQSNVCGRDLVQRDVQDWQPSLGQKWMVKEPPKPTSLCLILELARLTPPLVCWQQILCSPSVSSLDALPSQAVVTFLDEPRAHSQFWTFRIPKFHNA